MITIKAAGQKIKNAVLAASGFRNNVVKRGGFRAVQLHCHIIPAVGTDPGLSIEKLC